MIVRDRYGAIYVYVFADGGPERPVIAAIDAGEGDAPTWDATVSLLLDESANTRIDALDALVEIDNVAAIPLLGSALADPDEDVRAAAIGLLGDAGAVGTLQRDWTSRPATEQVQIVDELGDIESPQATAFLRRVAASGDQALASIARAYLDERK